MTLKNIFGYIEKGMLKVVPTAALVLFAYFVSNVFENLGVEQAITGRRLGDIGFAIQNHCEKNGYSVVREFVGHGIGRSMHEEPEVCNYGRRGNGLVLKSGMVLAIEPMICLGRRQVILEEDGWTARTIDRKPAAHYEHSVCVRNGKAEILSTFDYIKEVLGDRFI